MEHTLFLTENGFNNNGIFTLEGDELEEFFLNKSGIRMMEVVVGEFLRGEIRKCNRRYNENLLKFPCVFECSHVLRDSGNHVEDVEDME